MKLSERLQAVKLINQLLTEKIPLTHLLQAQPLPSPFTKELCFGVCRHYFRLQILADLLINKRPKSLEVWICILVGLYQLHYLDIAEYAVVKETVALLPQVNAGWAKGLVNAVLRRYCREQSTLMEKLNNNPSYLYGHPDWFINRIKKSWPNQWQTICLSNDERPPMSLRVNKLQTSTATYLSALHQVNIEARPLPYASQGIVLATPCDVQDLPGFTDGAISVQDEAAQLAVSLLDLKPGLRVLDACCAPGGKTAHILETEPQLAACIALDVDAYRLKRVKENLTRLKLSATIINNDGLDPAKWWDGKPFDRILLDAPCSATGVIRRHPDIKLLRTPEDITAITTVQHDLLNALWPLLSANGIMVYATCSIIPEENELQIAAFMQRHPDCQAISLNKPWGHALNYGIQILPGENHMDGFFYSVLMKKS
jgi:16S rRNA (cytosine967-C5)-methyltransferase